MGLLSVNYGQKALVPNFRDLGKSDLVKCKADYMAAREPGYTALGVKAGGMGDSGAIDRATCGRQKYVIQFIIQAFDRGGEHIHACSPIGEYRASCEAAVSSSAEENCLTENVSSLHSVKVATPCTAYAAITCGLAIRRRF